MDVGDQWNLDLIAEAFDPFDVLVLGHRDPDDLATRLLEPPALRESCLHVERVRRRHRLDPDGLVTAHHKIADGDFPGLVPLDHSRIGHRG